MSQGVAIFVENLEAFSAERARNVDNRLRMEGLPELECVYGLVYPDYPPEVPRPQRNREIFDAWRGESGVPLWAWVNASPSTTADCSFITAFANARMPSGWMLDIEGQWVHGADLDPLAKHVQALGKPRRASLAGASSSHVNYDFRALDAAGFDVEWQAYMDSGEGPPPQAAVRELYQSSFVIPGWEYRHHLNGIYGWCRVTRVEQAQRALIDSFKRPGPTDAYLNVSYREWGNTVVDRALLRDGKQVGVFLGKAQYGRIRVALDVTRTAQARPAHEWTPIAASARASTGTAKRGVAIYLGENATDDVIVAIARGAA